MSHTITSVDNFTVESVNFVVQGGTNLATTTGNTVVLTLVPNTGFQLDAADFSGTPPYPDGVLNMNFTQDGANVLCNVIVDATFVMPNENLSLPLCISGRSTELGITISGTVDISSSNATPLPQLVPYSISDGVQGQTQNVYTQTILADTDYYFNNTPTISLTTGNASNYSLYTANSQFSNGRLIGIDVIADYTFPFNDVAGDEIQVIANAIQIPALEEYVTGRSIATTIPAEATTRNLALFGVAGADYTLTVTSGATFSNGTDTITGVLGSGTTYEEVNFPAATQTLLYTLEILGDLDPTAHPSFWFIDILQEVISTISIGGTATATPADPNAYAVQDELNSGTWNGNSQAIQTAQFSHAVIGQDDRFILTWNSTPILDSDFVKTEDLPDGSFSVTTTRNTVDSYNLQLVVNLSSAGTTDQDMSYTIDLTPFVDVDYVTETVRFINESQDVQSFSYTDTSGTPQTMNVNPGDTQSVCARLFPTPESLGTGEIEFTGISCT